jgi:hypothetical protein
MTKSVTTSEFPISAPGLVLHEVDQGVLPKPSMDAESKDLEEGRSSSLEERPRESL